MRQRASDKTGSSRRVSSGPTDLERAMRACRSAFRTCALFSLIINVLMLASPVYMLQVYDRVLTTGRIETLVMLTLMAMIAIAVMCALDALRTRVTIRVGSWLNQELGPAYLACAVRSRLNGDPSGVEHLRDISQIQNFIATQGLSAFFDAPWVPIFVGLIWILHPMLGGVAIFSAVVLFLLSMANEFATRKATRTASNKQIEATLLADATIRNAETVQAMHMLPAMTRRWATVNSAVVDSLRISGDIGGLVLAITKFVRFFVQVAVGEIRLDGSPIHHWNGEQIGRHIGFLPQDVELFTGTVRDNIARMQRADDASVLKAAKLAYAHEMIQHLPQGYDTRIGDGGVRLSGGQRQRVGLARAVFGNPRFIVLDEPNANLDQAGEAALAEAIENLKRSGVALIVVGHRPSTLSVADKVLFLKEGHVVMFGERDEVLEELKARVAEPVAHGDAARQGRLSPGSRAVDGVDRNAKALAGAP